MDQMKHRRLQELKRSDFEIAEGQPDIRGWDVRLQDGTKIGKVNELIVDAQQRKVRYMVLDTSKADLELEDRKVLMPIGLAELHEKDDDVILQGVMPHQLSGLPVYEENRLDGSVENSICRALGRTQEEKFQYAEGTEVEPEFYQHDYFYDDHLYRHRLKEDEAKDHARDDYERGLRLWEKRSQVGMVSDEDSSHSRNRDEVPRRKFSNEEVPVHHNRPQHLRDAGRGYRKTSGRSKSIEDRIRREGLRDPGDPE